MFDGENFFYVFLHDLCLRRDFSVVFCQTDVFIKEAIINYVITKLLHQSFLVAVEFSSVFVITRCSTCVGQSEKLMAFRETILD